MNNLFRENAHGCGAEDVAHTTALQSKDLANHVSGRRDPGAGPG